ncbi:hypothetical protein Tco_0941914 [Tanacetum coccineum]|uniref:Uncharacterized protein n=1 Tax=Tanacetum coccineum TaxID=301880 RepID=A0ABQ5DT60_9ASTR
MRPQSNGDAKRSYYQESTPFDKDVRSFHQESEYEKAWSSGPDDFYSITGMVHRRRETRGSGFNYLNPSSPLHRFVLNYGKRGKAAPFS